MTLTEERKYQAILDKDPAFEGVFLTCVKTTGIFCRPVCTARKPKFENVEFVDSIKTALAKGYRPCKICAPLRTSGAMPDEIQALVEAVHRNPQHKISDQGLRERNIEPHTVRRWFLKRYGITFHAYQRMIRLNTAFKKIQSGHSVTDTAFDTGYESLSGFGDSFRAIFGVSPVKSRGQGVIDLTRIETPVGTMFAAAVSEGICLLEFTDRKMLETEFKALARHFNAVILPGENVHFDALRGQLAEYFSGNRKEFDLPLVMPGTPFQQSAWQALIHIPFGATRSYAQQAAAIERPEAVRAVAMANGMNKIAIIVPCHRIIGADGNLTGYGGGLWRKHWLLEHEQRFMSALQPPRSGFER